MKSLTRSKENLLAISLSSLAILVSQGCSVDLSHLRGRADGGSVQGDATVDGTGGATDSATINGWQPDLAKQNPDSSADSAGSLPDLRVAFDEAATDGEGTPDLATGDLADAAVNGPDSPAQLDTQTAADVGVALEVSVSIDAAVADVPVPDAWLSLDSTSPAITNISQNKPTTASSEQSGKEAIFGNDGANATLFCSANASFPAWWRVDLGATFNIVRTEVAFEKPDHTYLYKIDVSNDDSTFTTVVDQSANATRAGALQTDSFTAQARYVRITFLGALPAAGASPCLRDFAVWGSPVPGSPVPTNLALAGTAYRWYGNAAATSNANRVAEPRLNDDSVSVDFSLAGTVYPDGTNDYEAAGVVLAQASTIQTVVFVQGAMVPPPPNFPGDPDGNFTSGFRLQISTDGTTWSDATGWTLAPAYPYDASAANRAYVFSGSASGILGVRVTGLVHPDFVKSAIARAREIQAWASLSR